MNQKPNHWDALVACLFAVLLTFHPYYLEQQINLGELGLYLPGIDAIHRGLIPYRDFFYLRGPLELYVPAFLMAVFGQNISVLLSYFYAGTVLTILIYILIARQLLQTRFIFYLFLLVFIARTFPRVVFTYWGGLRYALGAAALFFMVRFFMTMKRRWIFLAGVTSACGTLISIEIGVCAFAGTLAALGACYFLQSQPRKFVLECCGIYLIGFALVLAPYGVYLTATESLQPFLETVSTVLVRMEKTFNFRTDAISSRDPLGILGQMLNPGSDFFKYLTPFYLYLVILGLFIYRVKTKKYGTVDFCLAGVGVYGFIMHLAAFRNITTSQFEMSLQPEKILLFYVFGEVYRWGLARKQAIRHPVPMSPAPEKTGRGAAAFLARFSHSRRMIIVINLWIFAMAVIAIGGSVKHLNRRFFAFKYMKYVLQGKDTQVLRPLAGQETKTLTLERAKGVTVPSWQAQELEEVADFIQRNSAPGDPVFLFPETSAYSFIVDRPFVGRFPMASITWMKEEWHQELMSQWKRLNPRYVILGKETEDFRKNYFVVPRNKIYYEEFLNKIHENYRSVREMSTFYIYQRKDLP